MRMTIRKWCNVISVIGILLMVVSSVYLWRMGVFSSQGKLRGFIAGFGIAGELVFVFIQIVQAVTPIIPGEISCLAGIIYLVRKWDLCIIMYGYALVLS